MEYSKEINDAIATLAEKGIPCPHCGEQHYISNTKEWCEAALNQLTCGYAAHLLSSDVEYAKRVREMVQVASQYKRGDPIL